MMTPEEFVLFEIEKCGENPVALLGRYTLRGMQDKSFDAKPYLTALKAYIKKHHISWDDYR